MRQNLVDIDFAADAVADIERALDTLDARFAELIALAPKQRQRITKMGNSSRGFCERALLAAQQCAGLMPRDFDIDGCVRDLDTMDQLFPWRLRIAHLHQRMSDTETALGSDLMAAALKVYAILKVSAEREGVDAAMDALAGRFVRPKRRAARTPFASPDRASADA